MVPDFDRFVQQVFTNASCFICSLLNLSQTLLVCFMCEFCVITKGEEEKEEEIIESVYVAMEL